MAAGRNKKRIKKNKKHRAGRKCRTRNGSQEKREILIGTADNIADHIKDTGSFMFDTASLKEDVWLDSNDEPTVDPLTNVFCQKALHYQELALFDYKKLPERIDIKLVFQAPELGGKSAMLCEIEISISAFLDLPHAALTEEMDYLGGVAFKESVMDQIARVQEHISDGLLCMIWEEVTFTKASDYAA